MLLQAPETGVAESTNKDNFVQTEQKIKYFSTQPMFSIYHTTTITFLVYFCILVSEFLSLVDSSHILLPFLPLKGELEGVYTSATSGEISSMPAELMGLFIYDLTIDYLRLILIDLFTNFLAPTGRNNLG